jgi:hypothetical protein
LTWWRRTVGTVPGRGRPTRSSMRAWIVHIFGAVGVLACLALVVGWLVTHYAIVRWEKRLPGGLVISAIGGAAGELEVRGMWRGKESSEWWRARSGTGPMTVTGQTVAVAGPTTFYASEIDVDMGAWEWHGVRWRAGAASARPSTISSGVMSTPLVPYRWLSVPWYFLLGVLMPPSVAWLIWLRRARRTRVGCCAICGYDLRATPERCPECGAVAKG